MFKSRGAVTARWAPAEDRIPEYVRAVDEALLRGEPVALVGRREFGGADLERWSQSHPGSGRFIDVGRRYFVFLGADIALVRDLGFRPASPTPRTPASPNRR